MDLTKIKAKKINSKEWVIGTYYDDIHGCYIATSPRILCESMNSDFVEIDSETISFPFPRKDNAGKQLYSGDIVKIEHGFKDEFLIGILTFHEGTFKLRSLQSSLKDKGLYELHRYWDDGTFEWESLENVYPNQIEYLGNIFDVTEEEYKNLKGLLNED